MSIRISREQTVAIASLSLVLASSLFVIGAALGEPANQEIADSATLHAATSAEQMVIQANRVTPFERQSIAQDGAPAALDMPTVDPPGGQNLTDDPLALFNMPPIL